MDVFFKVQIRLDSFEKTLNHRVRSIVVVLLVVLDVVALCVCVSSVSACLLFISDCVRRPVVVVFL